VRKDEHSTSSIADVKNKWSGTSTYPTCLHGVVTENFSFFFSFSFYVGKWMGRDSSVGVATRYGLDGPGIEARFGRDFPHPSRYGPRAHPAS